VIHIDDQRLTSHEAPRSASAGQGAPAQGARTRSPVEVTAGLLRGRFTALILWHLYWGGKSFYQLLRELDGVGRPALAHELEEMERAGLVLRRYLASGPRVVYALTSLGESLKPVIGVMYEWGLKALATNAETLAVSKRARPPQDAH
jgi:DNA-binding HxlR family transcriptional regulator